MVPSSRCWFSILQCLCPWHLLHINRRLPWQDWRTGQQQLNALVLKLHIFIPVYPEVEETYVLVNINYDLLSPPPAHRPHFPLLGCISSFNREGVLDDFLLRHSVVTECQQSLPCCFGALDQVPSTFPKSPYFIRNICEASLASN